MSRPKTLALLAVAATAVLIGSTSTSAQAAQTVTTYCRTEVGHSYSTAPWKAPFQNKAGYCLMQFWATAFGKYTGPIDGVLGTESWKGLQRGLSSTRYKYNGPIDGVPGTNTYKALQRLAQDGNYQGPVDGVMGDNSWLGVNEAISIQCFGD